MFPKVDPTSTTSWAALEQHASAMKTIRIKELFSRDADRFKNFSFRFNDTIIDFSKNRITEETIQLLQELALECGLKQAINAMFEGEFINETEHRSVLHVALRNGTGEAFFSAGKKHYGRCETGATANEEFQ